MDDGGESEVRSLARRYRQHYRDAHGDDREARKRAETAYLGAESPSDLVASAVHDGRDPMPLLDALLDAAEEADDLEFLYFVAAGPIEEAIVDRPDLRESIAVRCSLDARWRFTVEHGVWVDEELLPSLPEVLRQLLTATAVPRGAPAPRRSRARRATWRSQRAEARRRRRR